jgi:hypothetical protein
MAMLPSGDAKNGLGGGHVQMFLPLWLQKCVGAWTTYGAEGTGSTREPGNRDYWFIGWLVQRKMVEHAAAGIEIFHTTPKEVHGESETRFNVGLVVDFTDSQHLLFSAGRGIQGSNDFQGYLAYQLNLWASRIAPSRGIRSAARVPSRCGSAVLGVGGKPPQRTLPAPASDEAAAPQGLSLAPEETLLSRALRIMAVRARPMHVCR